MASKIGHKKTLSTIQSFWRLWIVTVSGILLVTFLAGAFKALISHRALIGHPTYYLVIVFTIVGIAGISATVILVVRAFISTIKRTSP